MSQSFPRIASAELQINGTDQTVTISNVPYIWMPEANPSMDTEGMFAVMDYMRTNLDIKGRTLTLVSAWNQPA